MKIGQNVPEMLSASEDDELRAVKAYNRGIALAREFADESTAHRLGKILRMEEEHMDWAERQRLQIEQLGLQNYLARQTKGAAG
jgi:bacterioferritin (cytochrome b1)